MHQFIHFRIEKKRAQRKNYFNIHICINHCDKYDSNMMELIIELKIKKWSSLD